MPNHGTKEMPKGLYIFGI